MYRSVIFKITLLPIHNSIDNRQLRGTIDDDMYD
jgi:hypothetical protein